MKAPHRGLDPRSLPPLRGGGRRPMSQKAKILFYGSSDMKSPFQQHLRRPQGLWRYAVVAEHLGDFLDALLGIQQANVRLRAFAFVVLVDEVMVLGLAGHLGQVGDGDELQRIAHLPHDASDFGRHFARNARVDFVEDEGGDVVPRSAL